MKEWGKVEANWVRCVKNASLDIFLLVCLFFMLFFKSGVYAVPTVTNVEVRGPVREGGQVFVTYTYSDTDGIAEGDTRIILYRDGEIIQESDNEVNIYTSRTNLSGIQLVPSKIATNVGTKADGSETTTSIGTNTDKSTTVYNIIDLPQFQYTSTIVYPADVAKGVIYSLKEKDIGHRIRAKVIPVNANGTEGVGVSSNFTQFVVRPTYIDTDYIKVVTSNTHSLGLKPDGTVWAWGNNVNGCLGIGKTESELASSEHPVRVMQEVNGTTTLEPLKGIRDIACGDGWSFALYENNYGYCWGYLNSTYTPTNRTEAPKFAGYNGSSGIQNISSYINRISATNTGPRIVTASASNTWYFLTTTNNGSALLSSAGYGFTLGLNKEGYVIANGSNTENVALNSNSKGQLGQGNTTNVINAWVNVKTDASTDLSNITYVKSARNYSIALDKSGYLWFWGNGTLYATKMTGITTIGDDNNPTEKVVDYVLLDNKIYVLTEVISTGENKIYETSTLSPTATFTLNQTSATPMRLYGNYNKAYVNKQVTINGETCLRTYDLSTGNKIPANPIVTSVAIRRISRIDSNGTTQSMIGPWTRETIANSSSYTGEYLYKLPSDIPDIIRNQLPANTTINGVTYDPYRVGDTLEGSYDYFDEDVDAESGTIFQWYRSGAPIDGANSITYTLTDYDMTHEISFKVIPKDGRTSGYGEEGLYSSILTPLIFPSLNEKSLEDKYIEFNYSSPSYGLKASGSLWRFTNGVGTLPVKMIALDNKFIIGAGISYVINVDGTVVNYSNNKPNGVNTLTNIVKESNTYFLTQSGEVYGYGDNYFNNINTTNTNSITTVTPVIQYKDKQISDAIMLFYLYPRSGTLGYINQNSNLYAKCWKSLRLNVNSDGTINKNSISTYYSGPHFGDPNEERDSTRVSGTTECTYLSRVDNLCGIDFVSREGFCFRRGGTYRNGTGGGIGEHNLYRLYKNRINGENYENDGPIENAIKICSTYGQISILDINGYMWGSGGNSYGQLGLGDTTTRNSSYCFKMKNENGNGDLSQILNFYYNMYYSDAGGQAIYILKKNDLSLYGCGKNDGGELGTGTMEVETIPRRIQPKDNDDIKYYENANVVGSVSHVAMRDSLNPMNGMLMMDGNVWQTNQFGNITLIIPSEYICTQGIYNGWKIKDISQITFSGYDGGCVFFIAKFVDPVSNTEYENRLFYYGGSGAGILTNRYTAVGSRMYKIEMPSTNESLYRYDNGAQLTYNETNKTWDDVPTDANIATFAYAKDNANYNFDINKEVQISQIYYPYATYTCVYVQDLCGNLWTWNSNREASLGHSTGTNGDNLDSNAYNYNMKLLDTNVKKIPSNNSTNYSSAVAMVYLKNDNTLWGCGYNANYRLFHKIDGENNLSTYNTTKREIKLPEEVTKNIEGRRIKYICTNVNRILIINEANEMWVWGTNIYANTYDENGNIVTGGKNTAQLNTSSASRYVTPLRIVWNEELYGKVKVVEMASVVFVILTQNGDLYTFGYGPYGEIGNGRAHINSSQAVYEPQKIMSNIKTIVAGHGMVSAIDNDGILYRWGNNNSGQLYTGRMTNLVFPTLIGNPVTSFEPSAGLFNNPTAVTNANVNTNGIALYKDIGYKWQRSDKADDGNIPILTFALGNESTVTSSRDFATDINTVMNGYYTQEDQTRLAIVSQELLVYPVGQWETQAEGLITALQEELYAIGTDISPLIDGKNTTEKIDSLREYNQTALNVRISECLNSIAELLTEDERTALATEKEQLETKRDQVAYATDYYQTDGTYYLWIYMYNRNYDIGGNEVQGAVYSPTTVKSISGGFPIDKTAPVIANVHIASNVTTPEGTANPTIAKEGSRVVISFISNEQIDINRVELVDEVYEKVFKVSINGANQTLNILSSGDLTNSGDIKQTQQQDGTYKIEYLFIPTASTADGTINFAIRGIYDNAGNLHADVTNANITDGSSVLVDNTAPIITYVKSTTLDGKKQITITTYDNGSGVSNYPNQVNPIYVHGGVNNNDYIANGGVIIVSDDATSISIEAYDKAGNLATETPNIESISVFDITPKNGATIPIYQPIVITFPGEDIDYYTSAEDTLSKISLTYKVVQNGVEVTKNERVAIKSMVADNGETKITIGPVSGLFASNTEYSFIMQNDAIKSTTSGKGYSAITTTFTTSISEITNDTIAVYTVPVNTYFEVTVPGDFGDTSENGVSLSGWNGEDSTQIYAGIVTAHKVTDSATGKGVIQYTDIHSKPSGFSSTGKKIVYIEALKKYIVFNVVANPGDTTITV